MQRRFIIINMSPRTAIVNLINNNGYSRGQERLSQFWQTFGADVDFVRLGNEQSVGSPLHKDNPYAFKIYAIEHVRQKGYDQILWLDASVYPVKDITPVFDWLTDKGIFLEEAGHLAGSWCPQRVLDYFGITKEQAMQMPMFSAGFCGFDFTNPISVEFFAEWKESMLNGMFKGSWADHRHDMTCGSIIANKQGLLPLYSPGGQFFAYVGPGFSQPKETVCFHLQGL